MSSYSRLELSPLLANSRRVLSGSCAWACGWSYHLSEPVPHGTTAHLCLHQQEFYCDTCLVETCNPSCMGCCHDDARQICRQHDCTHHSSHHVILSYGCRNGIRLKSYSCTACAGQRRSIQCKLHRSAGRSTCSPTCIRQQWWQRVWGPTGRSAGGPVWGSARRAVWGSARRAVRRSARRAVWGPTGGAIWWSAGRFWRLITACRQAAAC